MIYVTKAGLQEFVEKSFFASVIVVGAFLSAIINFFLIAFVLFTIIKIFNRIAETKERMANGEETSRKRAI